MKLRDGKKVLANRSTGLTKYEEAYVYAEREYFRLRNADALGHSLKDYTFQDHWDDWHKRKVNLGAWKAERQRWHEKLATRYFKEYFRYPDGTSMRLNEINAAFAKGYWEWRISYWKAGPGAKLIAYNPKRRGAKTKSTYNAAKIPAKKTLQMEQAALNEIFNDAREQGRLQQEFQFKAPFSPDVDTRRPHFDQDDRLILMKQLRFYSQCQGVFKEDRVNKSHLTARQQLYRLVGFLINSGLRIGEARQMRWCDVLFDQVNPNGGDPVSVVSVRKATKKKQNRDVQTQPYGNLILKRWKDETPFKGKNDYVWFTYTKDDAEQRPIGDLTKTFQNFLKRVPVEGRQEGLLVNREGERYAIYSLRHTYATLRRQHGVSWEDLALNMGCGVAQLEKHYDHSTSNTRRGPIVVTTQKTQPLPVASQSDPALRALMAEALALYDAGDLTHGGLVKFLKAGLTESGQN